MQSFVWPKREKKCGKGMVMVVGMGNIAVSSGNCYVNEFYNFCQPKKVTRWRETLWLRPGRQISAKSVSSFLPFCPMRGQTKVLFSFCFGVFAFRCIPIEPKYTLLIYTLPFFLVPLCESLALYKIANQFVSQRQLVVWLVFALNTFNHTNDYDCIFVIKLIFQGVKGQ